MGWFLGVDLGTTWTAAAVVRDGRCEIVPLSDHRAEIPSVVASRSPGDGDLLVGDAAERRAGTDPASVAREFKRRLGDPTPVLLHGTPWSAHALTATLLRWVVAQVSAREGGPPDAVVVTRPANWGGHRQEVFGQALAMADLADALVVTEPEAAALRYASLARLEPGGTIAVYDLGGGTFDATVLRRTADGFAVLGVPTGIEQLGGVDVDDAVLGHVVRALGAQLEPLDPDDPAVALGLTRLRADCTVAKEALSYDSEVAVPVALPGLHTAVRLTRAELEDLVRPVLLQTVEALRRALRSAEVEPEQLDGVLLAGGSSRMPLVGQLLMESLGRPVVADAHPKHLVAMGAALAGAQAAPAADAVVPPPAGAPDRPAMAGRRRQVLVAAAALALVVAATGTYAALRGGPERGTTVSTTRSPTPSSVATSARPTPPLVLPALPRSKDALPVDQLVLAGGPTLDRATLVRTTAAPGAARTVLLTGPGQRYLPALSPDRRTVAYVAVATPGGPGALRVVGADGGSDTAVDGAGAIATRVAWSPDGTRLAFAARRDGRTDLFVGELDATPPGVRLTALRALTADPAEEDDATWSPDGTQIAYWTDKDGRAQVYRVDVAPGGVPRPVATSPGADMDPAWSPDGSRIAMRRDGAPGRTGIVVVAVQGAATTVLTPGTTEVDEDPTWSPDGRSLVFSRREGPGGTDRALWRVGALGQPPLTRLTGGTAWEGHASWSAG